METSNELIMALAQTPTIFPEDLVQNKPSVLPIIIIVPRKLSFKRIFQEDELNNNAYKQLKIYPISTKHYQDISDHVLAL